MFYSTEAKELSHFMFKHFFEAALRKWYSTALFLHCRTEFELEDVFWSVINNLFLQAGVVMYRFQIIKTKQF